MAVLRGESLLIVVLPTGGGKTLLVILPAMLENDGVQIFVAPFRALVDDMVERFRKEGIDACKWRPGQANPARIVVMSVDTAAGTSFLLYARQMADGGLLRRIFINEGHLTFTSSDWRPKLGKLRQLQGIPRPMVLLTATLPPLQEFKLELAMAISTSRIIRASTTRPHHRYTVQYCRPGELAGQAVRICQNRVRHLERGEKGVVYVLSRLMCEELAEALGCPYYHAGDINREERLSRWLAQGGFMVATSALGTGVNFRGIMFVLHVDLLWSIIDFAQESGRAGRDGEVVTSTVLMEAGTVERRMESGALSVGRGAMGEFMVTRGCQRWVISEYLDGSRLAARCEDIGGGARCDGCREGGTELQEQGRRWARERAGVEKLLDLLTGCCVLCWAQREDPEELWREHRITGCVEG